MLLGVLTRVHYGVLSPESCPPTSISPGVRWAAAPRADLRWAAQAIQGEGGGGKLTGRWQRGGGARRRAERGGGGLRWLLLSYRPCPSHAASILLDHAEPVPPLYPPRFCFWMKSRWTLTCSADPSSCASSRTSAYGVHVWGGIELPCYVYAPDSLPPPRPPP